MTVPRGTAENFELASDASVKSKHCSIEISDDRLDACLDRKFPEPSNHNSRGEKYSRPETPYPRWSR